MEFEATQHDSLFDDLPPLQSQTQGDGIVLSDVEEGELVPIAESPSQEKNDESPEPSAISDNGAKEVTPDKTKISNVSQDSNKETFEENPKDESEPAAKDAKEDRQDKDDDAQDEKGSYISPSRPSRAAKSAATAKIREASESEEEEHVEDAVDKEPKHENGSSNSPSPRRPSRAAKSAATAKIRKTSESEHETDSEEEEHVEDDQNPKPEKVSSNSPSPRRAAKAAASAKIQKTSESENESEKDERVEEDKKPSPRRSSRAAKAAASAKIRKTSESENESESEEDDRVHDDEAYDANGAVVDNEEDGKDEDGEVEGDDDASNHSTASMKSDKNTAKKQNASMKRKKASTVAVKTESSVKKEQEDDDYAPPKKKRARVSEAVVTDAAQKMLAVLIQNFKDGIKQISMDVLAGSITSKRGKPYTNHRSDAIVEGMKRLKALDQAEKIMCDKIGAAKLSASEIAKIPKEIISKDPTKVVEQRRKQFLERLAKHKKGGTGERVVAAANIVWNMLAKGEEYTRKELVKETEYSGTNSSGFEGIMKVLSEMEFIESKVKGKCRFVDNKIFPHGRPK